MQRRQACSAPTAKLGCALRATASGEAVRPVPSFCGRRRPSPPPAPRAGDGAGLTQEECYLRSGNGPSPPRTRGCALLLPVGRMSGGGQHTCFLRLARMTRRRCIASGTRPRLPVASRPYVNGALPSASRPRRRRPTPNGSGPGRRGWASRLPLQPGPRLDSGVDQPWLPVSSAVECRNPNCMWLTCAISGATGGT
jgi:hypothetical protein